MTKTEKPCLTDEQRDILKIAIQRAIELCEYEQDSTYAYLVGLRREVHDMRTTGES